MANELIEELRNWQYHKIGDSHLYAHPDLEVTRETRSSVDILLLGFIFDPAHPTKTNAEIISDVISMVKNFNDFIAIIKKYAGRYALIYRDRSNFTIMHDMVALREIYYCTHTNRIICGSQPNLINAFSLPKLGVTQDKNILHFYEHDMKTVRSGRLWVGDETYYHHVKHLMPNYYLDIQSLTAKRYWPNRNLDRIDLNTAIKLSCEYLTGIMQAVTSRYNVMMAVTAGIDSRSLLAASREVKDQIYYFINKKPPLSDKSADIRIPKRIFSKINLPFHIHDATGPVDEEFKNVFLNNVFMSTDLLLPAIYNVYYKNHQNKLNLLGVGEIGRGMFGMAKPGLTGYELAHKLKYKHSMYAISQCENWLKQIKEAADAYNIDIMSHFIWWSLSGNWAAVGNSESDIAIEEFNPYDSHHLTEIILSVDWADRAIPNNRGIPSFYEGMFREMWPELLDFPFNPPDTIEGKIKYWLEQVGILQPLKRLRFKFDYWRFRNLANKVYDP